MHSETHLQPALHAPHDDGGPGRPDIGEVSSTDQRREAPTRLATIMGGFGNPLKTLDTAKPVKDKVVDASIAGLRQRGLLAAPGSANFRIALTIRKFDADMIIGRTARIDLTMALLDSSGRVLLQDIAVDTESNMKFFEKGVLANISDLQVLSETVLSRTVNQMMDSPNFRTALVKQPMV